jgi:hypothetical protein
MGHQLVNSLARGISRLPAPAPRRQRLGTTTENVVGPVEPETPFDELPSLAIPSTDFEVSNADSHTGIVAAPAKVDQGSEALEPVPFWFEMYRSLPSWLSSLVLHLAIILTLALATFSASKHGTIELSASSVDTNEPILSLNVLLEPDDQSSEQEMLESKIQELQEPNLVVPEIDHLLTSTTLESVEFGDPFESISTTGVEDEANLVKDRQFKEGTDFFGITGNGANFVFIIDCSGSMAEYGRWRRAVNELKKSIEALAAQQKFLIILYNDGHISMNDPPTMVPATAKNKRDALQWLAGNRPEGWTYCGDAMLNALLQQPDSIFLLSDGEFNDRKHVFDVLEKNNPKNNKKYKQIPVHTIALGSHQGKWTMKKIADDNNGIYTLIVD